MYKTKNQTFNFIFYFFYRDEQEVSANHALLCENLEKDTNLQPNACNKYIWHVEFCIREESYNQHEFNFSTNMTIPFSTNEPVET